MKKVLLAVAVALLLSACATTEIRTSAELHLTVQAATMQVIDRDTEKAERVLELVNEARAFVNGSEVVSVSALAADVRAKIEWQKLEPASQVLLSAILMRAEQILSDMLAEKVGGITPDGRLTVLTLLDWIEAAASGVVG